MRSSFARPGRQGADSAGPDRLPGLGRLSIRTILLISHALTAVPAIAFGIIVAVIQYEGLVAVPLHIALFLDLAAALVVIALAAVGSYYVSRLILQPINQLDEAARAWSAGDLAKRVQIETGGELAALGDTFNQMASSLASTLELLRDVDRRLLAERNRLEVILNTSPTGIIVVDHEGRTLLMNPTAQTLTGETTSGAEPFEQYASRLRVFRPDGAPIAVSEFPVMRALCDGLTMTGVEIVLRRPNGWEVHLLSNAAPLRDDRGNVVGAVSVFFDVTPLVEEERLRREFVLSAAHEFRNPLTVIKGYAEVASRDAVVQGTNVERELARILDAADRVSTLADQLIQAAQLHLPTLFLRKEVVDLARLVRDTVERFAATEKAPKHRVVVQAGAAFVQGDPRLLGEAVTDLVKQAIAVTPVEKDVAVAVSAWDGIATVAVTDHGPPVSVQDLPALFTPFVARIASGSTLGASRHTLLLYLARRIVEESGGWMRASSADSITTITFSLPRYVPCSSVDRAPLATAKISTDDLPTRAASEPSAQARLP